MRIYSLACSVVLVALAVSPIRLHAEAIGYINAGQFVPLDPVQDELTVRSATESPAVIEKRIVELGFPGFRHAESLGVQHYLFSREDASGTPSPGPIDISDVVSALARVVDGFVSPVFNRIGRDRTVVRPEIHVRFERDFPRDRAEALLASVGEITEAKWAGWDGAYQVRVATQSALEALALGNDLARTPGVLWARADRSNFSRGPSGSYPDDPYYQAGESWMLDHTGAAPWGPLSDLDINGPEVWNGGSPPGQIGAANVVVLIMDTGVQFAHTNTPAGCGQSAHPDLNISASWSTDTTDHVLTCDGAAPDFCDNHGTWLAGVVAGKIDNSEGTTGIAPGVTLGSARAYGVDGGTTCSTSTYEYAQSWVVEALAFAQGELAAGQRVVTNFSANPTLWGTTSEPLETAYLEKYVETWKEGFVHFVSAGNGGLSTVQIPGRQPGAELDVVNAITNLTYVSGDSQPHLDSTSSYGSDADFTAPGTRILTTDRGNNLGACTPTSGHSYCLMGVDHYAYLTGTSYSSPAAAAVAALVLSENASLSAQAVEWVLRETAVDLGSPGRDVLFGWGLPKADAAVALATDLLFYDGFETGSTECWDAGSPCSGGN